MTANPRVRSGRHVGAWSDEGGRAAVAQAAAVASPAPIPAGRA
jgi:hypothetical protein